jgi:hypothetical protein
MKGCEKNPEATTKAIDDDYGLVFATPDLGRYTKLQGETRCRHGKIW